MQFYVRKPNHSAKTWAEGANTFLQIQAPKRMERLSITAQQRSAGEDHERARPLARKGIVRKATSNELERMRRKGEPSRTARGNIRVQPQRRMVWRFLRKLEIELPYDPAVPRWGILSEKTIILKATCATCSLQLCLQQQDAADNLSARPHAQRSACRLLVSPVSTHQTFGI